MNPKKYYSLRQSIRNASWNGISRRKAKGKAGNSGIMARNGQVEQVPLDRTFSKPNWTKFQR